MSDDPMVDRVLNHVESSRVEFEFVYWCLSVVTYSEPGNRPDDYFHTTQNPGTGQTIVIRSKYAYVKLK
jgi:hypothetical protein